MNEYDEILDFETVVYYLLSGSTELQNYLNESKIYPLIADKETQSPFIIYSVGGKPEYLGRDSFLNDVILEITIVSVDFGEMKSISKIINRLFNTIKGQFLEYNIRNSKLIDYDTFSNQFEKTDEYVTKLTYSIKF